MATEAPGYMVYLSLVEHSCPWHQEGKWEQPTHKYHIQLYLAKPQEDS